MTTNDTTAEAFTSATSGVNGLGATMKDGIEMANDTAALAIDQASDAAHSVREQLAPALKDGVDRAQTLLNQSLESLRDSADVVRDKAQMATEQVAAYTREEPIKALLIAAAVGAGLIVLLGLMRSSD